MKKEKIVLKLDNIADNDYQFSVLLSAALFISGSSGGTEIGKN